MLPVFELEDYLLRHEARATVSLCASGLETVGLGRLLSLADAETLALWQGLVVEYSQPQGFLPLREEIAGQYETVSAEQVCVFAGAAEAIICTLQGLLRPTDHAVVVVPCYQSLESIPASLCETTRVSLDAANGWTLNLEVIEAALRPNTRLIVINFPNNPTGAIPERATLLNLVELARSRNIYLFSDEVYRGMEVNPADRLPALVDVYERGISIGSFSKLYGLPGLRIGWAAAREPEVIRAAIGKKHYMSICPNSASEIMALMALRAQDAIVPPGMDLMRRNLHEMTRFFERYSELFHWQEPQGGCLGFPELKTNLPAEQFTQQLLEAEGVLVLPSHLYGLPDTHLRVSYGKASMPEALSRLERFTQQSYRATLSV